VNDAANPAGTRVRFDRIELEDGVDYLVIYDLDNNPYQWITGSHPNGLTSKAVPGAGIKVQLISDGSGRAWGYNLVAVESGAPTGPDAPPQRGPTLAESNHPYSGAIQTWTLTNPDPNAVSSKVHFSRIELQQRCCYPTGYLQVLDANDVVVQQFAGPLNIEDVWSDYVPGRIVKLKLFPDGTSAWGFRVDQLASSVSNPGLVQSHHPYSGDIQTWTLTNPDATAVSSKVHFSRIELQQRCCYPTGYLQVLDANDVVIQQFAGPLDIEDVWSDYVPGRIVKLKLFPDGTSAWGFRVDQLVNSVNNPGLAQSNHPYSGDVQTWTIINPNVNASYSRIHFDRVELQQKCCYPTGVLEVLDNNDVVVQTFRGPFNQADFWSDQVPGRIVKLRLTPEGTSAWGFRVDAIEPSSTNPVPPAGINGIYVQINAPGDVYLNGKKLFRATAAGEYRIALAAAADVAIREASPAGVAPGLYSIRIEYATSEQMIEVRVGATGGIEIVYLPLVRR
jgi:hypothetical protein